MQAGRIARRCAAAPHHPRDPSDAPPPGCSRRWPSPSVWAGATTTSPDTPSPRPTTASLSRRWRCPREPELAGSVIDHRLRVRIDDPPASLAVWVMDPSNERYLGGGEEGTPRFERIGDGPRVTAEPRATILLLHGYYDYINQDRFLMWSRILRRGRLPRGHDRPAGPRRVHRGVVDVRRGGGA